MNRLIEIHKAVDANFHCWRKSQVEYQKPLRAIELKKTSYEDVMKININQDGEDKEVSIWTTIPIIMAIGIATNTDHDMDDIMDFWNIDSVDEYEYKLKCYTSALEKSIEALNSRVRGDDYDEGAYRFYVKFCLVNNYLLFHEKNSFFKSQDLLR